MVIVGCLKMSLLEVVVGGRTPPISLFRSSRRHAAWRISSVAVRMAKKNGAVSALGRDSGSGRGRGAGRAGDEMEAALPPHAHIVCVQWFCSPWFWPPTPWYFACW
jgi:hypothetical protein